MSNNTSFLRPYISNSEKNSFRWFYLSTTKIQVFLKWEHLLLQKQIPLQNCSCPIFQIYIRQEQCPLRSSFPLERSRANKSWSREGKEMAQSFFWPWPWSKRHLCKKEVNARGGRSVWKKFARNSSFSCVSHAAFSRLLVSLLHRLNADTVNTLSCCATKGTTSGHWKCRSIQIPTFSMERLFTVAPLWIVSVV